MAPTDPWLPLIVYAQFFAHAVVNPTLAVAVVTLVVLARTRWLLMAGLPTLGALDATFVRLTETYPPPWPILATGEGLAVLLHGAIAGLAVGLARRWGRWDDR